MRMLAMLFARFSAGFPGLCLRLAFGERRGLPLASAFDFVEPFLEVLDELLQFSDAAQQRFDDSIAFDAPRA
jgi:hypothetical protein